VEMPGEGRPDRRWLAAAHGARRLFGADLGIESGSPAIQQYIRKRLDLDRTTRVVRLVSEAGIFVKAFFMLGFPIEEWSDIQETIRYAISLRSL